MFVTRSGRVSQGTSRAFLVKCRTFEPRIDLHEASRLLRMGSGRVLSALDRVAHYDVELRMSIALRVRTPCVLRVDLTRFVASRGVEGAALDSWSDPDPRIERTGRASGSALAAALFHRAIVDDASADPLVLSVGAAVRAGLPTSARTSLVARSVLNGALSEGQIGGAFGRSLANVTDALMVTGQSGMRGAVLVVHADARVELVVDRELVGASPRETRVIVARRFGECAALAIGRGGEAELPFASIASLEDPPSFVGRGGLGAAFARLGLKAIVVLATAVVPDPARAALDRELQRALARSPRLRARSAGGTLELGASPALRTSAAGLQSPNEDEIRSDGLSGVAIDAFDALSQTSVAKKGCDGCPTPCGLVFERGHPRGATRHLARFGALNALADRVGLALDDARRLLERCDELAIDAKEVGSVLALARAVSRNGAAFTLESALLQLDLVVERRGLGAVLALGSHAAAHRLGVAPRAARGSESELAATNLAVRLAADVSPRGSDPMRTFSFSAVDAASRARLVSTMDGVPLPRGAEDPDDPAGKGRIVWWHENLVCALDATGFCAFSAAGLLSDGVATLDELSRWIGSKEMRESSSPGRALLALGASIALLRRDITTRLGVRLERTLDAVLDHASMRREYEMLRGIDADGRPTERALSALGDEHILDVVNALTGASRAAETRADPEPTAPRFGRVLFCAGGPLGRALDRECAFEGLFPARLRECVDALARRVPFAAQWLVLDGRMVPQAWRDGHRLEPDDWIADGERIDLVIAVGGG